MTEEELVVAYKAVFASPNGREILNDLMMESNFYQADFTEPNRTMYNEGKRSVVLRIFKMINMDVTRLREIIKEDAEASRQEEY